MDKRVAALPARADGDLMFTDAGIAYQADQSHLVPYDDAYWRKCAGYEGNEIATLVTQCRIAMVARHYTGRVCDVGIGAGEFIKARPNTCGHDVNPVAIDWLRHHGLWAERLEDFGALTFWDVLEHCPDPGEYLRCIGLHCFLFCSVPIFKDLARVRESRHYRPGEHLYYWTQHGFLDWMSGHGFLVLELNDHETRAGRDSIKSFAFKRFAWPK